MATFENIKKQVGKNIKYYTNADGWLTNKDVTEDDIGDFINDIYRDDLFTLFATQYPSDFVQIAFANSWIATATVENTSTASTLVVNAAIFTNSVEGLTVYNPTADEYAVIESFVDSETVTLDTEINDTWDGDTIYVLGQEFTFGGDANDLYVVNQVSTKYNDSDTYYRVATRRDKTDFFQYGFEVGAEAVPDYYLTTVNVNNVLTSAIGLLPGFKKKISNAIQIEYIKKPTTLTSASDVPRLPVDSALIYGATMRAYEAKREFQEASYWANKYEQYKKTAIARYRPLSTRQQTRIRPPRHISGIYNRTY